MNRLILADDQIIFRAGAARALALEDDMRIVAQCEDAGRLRATLPNFRSSVVVLASSLASDLPTLLRVIADSGSRVVLILEKDAELAGDVAAEAGGIVPRSVTAAELIDCVRRVGRGQKVERASVATMPAQDAVGARVRDRLTPKEMQIVALIVQGCKNKDIAAQLGTKEQVIKNYLRSIYDKTGVSDRLELALFTLHHRMLKEAATRAGKLLQMKSA